jgi:hypothetical protein
MRRLEGFSSNPQDSTLMKSYLEMPTLLSRQVKKVIFFSRYFRNAEHFLEPESSSSNTGALDISQFDVPKFQNDFGSFITNKLSTIICDHFDHVIFLSALAKLDFDSILTHRLTSFSQPLRITGLANLIISSRFFTSQITTSFRKKTRKSSIRYFWTYIVCFYCSYQGFGRP